MAHIKIHLSKIKYNAIVLKKILDDRGIQMMPVLKCAGGDIQIAQLFENIGFDLVAESRLNLIESDSTHLDYMMIKGATPTEVPKVVNNATISLQTDLNVIRAINEEAKKQRKSHSILLMIDWKDGREGILTYEAIDYLNEIIHLDSIYLKGIAFNFMCFRPLPPTEEDISYIERFILNIKKATGLNFPTISGGNSSMLSLAMYHDLGAINELRIGEALFRGYETAYQQRLPFLYEDTIEIVGQILEIKPRLNVSTRQAYMQALVDIGQLDTEISELIPKDEKLNIVGSTSDLLLLDLGGAYSYQVGDSVSFKMGYGAIAQSMYSKQMKKLYYQDKGIETLIENFSSATENKVLNQY